MTSPITEFDLRAEEFKDPYLKPEHFERRDDGAIVRKDRWEKAVRAFAETFGLNTRQGFEITAVVERAECAYAGETALHELYKKLCAEQVRLQGLERTATSPDSGAGEIHQHRREGITAAIRMLTDVCGENGYVLT